MARKKLTPKQEAFTEHYIANGGNGVRAAQAAGYAGSYSTLNEVARDNLQKPVIQEFLRERLKGVKANADEVLFLLADHMRADIAVFADCVNEDGSLDLKRAKQSGCSHLVKKLKIKSFRDKNGNLIKQTEIELHDAQAAARTLADIHGMKQQARQNDDDVARVSREVARLVSEGWEPEQAKAIILEAEPKAAKWLM